MTSTPVLGSATAETSGTLLGPDARQELWNVAYGSYKLGPPPDPDQPVSEYQLFAESTRNVVPPIAVTLDDDDG
jgi:hypothetical protein